MLAYIATYLFFAFLLEVARRCMDGPLFIRTRSKHFPWKLNYSIRWWGVDEYLAALTLGSLGLLLLLALWAKLASPVDLGAVLQVWVTLCLSSLVLSIRYFNLVARFKENFWWLALIAALITLGLGQFASAWADYFIVHYTRTEATQFPVAQKSLTLLVLAFIWLYAATMLISVIVIVVYMFMNEMKPTFRESVKRDPLSAPFLKKYKPGRTDIRRAAMRWIVLGVSLFSVSSSWSVLDFVLAHAEEGVQETLVFAAFHLHPRDCAIPGMPQGARAALISEKQAVIAIPEAKGYVFETMPCDVQSTRVLEEEAAKRLKQDDYF
jgi:F0F1-type ATP synthase membrane subunit c/vacuolar-type H+-ATPase subunit K